MAYTSNYVEIVADAGEYEVEIINADVRSTNNGKQFLNVAFKIHSLNLVVYDTIWRDYNVPNEFNKKRVAQLLTAIKFNEDEEIADDFGLIQTIKGKKLIIVVTKEYNDTKQKEENKVKEYKQILVTDEDLPF
jgi:DNA polymerase III delta prime subunit